VNTLVTTKWRSLYVYQSTFPRISSIAFKRNCISVPFDTPTAFFVFLLRLNFDVPYKKLSLWKYFPYRHLHLTLWIFFKYSSFCPFCKLGIYSFPLTVFFRKLSPWCSCSVNPQYSVHYSAVIIFWRASTFSAFRMFFVLKEIAVVPR